MAVRKDSPNVMSIAFWGAPRLLRLANGSSGGDSLRVDMPKICASFTVDPAGIATHVVFLFPDRQPDLHLVYDVSARFECLVTMY